MFEVFWDDGSEGPYIDAVEVAVRCIVAGQEFSVRRMSPDSDLLEFNVLSEGNQVLEFNVVSDGGQLRLKSAYSFRFEEEVLERGGWRSTRSASSLDPNALERGAFRVAAWFLLSSGASLGELNPTLPRDNLADLIRTIEPAPAGTGICPWPEEESELYRMLGEPLPCLWPWEHFLEDFGQRFPIEKPSG